MDFKTRRRLMLGKSLLPLIVWNNKMSSLEEIPVEYTTTGASVVSSASGSSIEITSRPAMMTQNFIFKIPKKYVKKAKQCNINGYSLKGRMMPITPAIKSAITASITFARSLPTSTRRMCTDGM